MVKLITTTIAYVAMVMEQMVKVSIDSMEDKINENKKDSK